MAARGTIYRCDFLSTATAAAPITVQWTQALTPIGSRQLRSGDLAEILVRVENGSKPIDADTHISFEVVTSDFALTGAPSDRLLLDAY